jgi:hypothetical protein
MKLLNSKVTLKEGVMKNKIKVLGIITIIALIGSFVACVDDDSSTKNSITISGTPKIGSIITVNVKGDYWEGPYWEISADGVNWGDFKASQNGVLLFYKRDKEITIPEDNEIEGGVLNHYIRASVQRTSERSSSDYSNVLGPIEEP